MKISLLDFKRVTDEKTAKKICRYFRNKLTGTLEVKSFYSYEHGIIKKRKQRVATFDIEECFEAIQEASFYSNKQDIIENALNAIKKLPQDDFVIEDIQKAEFKHQRQDEFIARWNKVILKK